MVGFGALDVLERSRARVVVHAPAFRAKRKITANHAAVPVETKHRIRLIAHVETKINVPNLLRAVRKRPPRPAVALPVHLAIPVHARRTRQGTVVPGVPTQALTSSVRQRHAVVVIARKRLNVPVRERGAIGQ